MKIEGFPDLFFIVLVFVPGFIFCSVRSKFIVRRESSKETTLLRFLTVSAFNYAICSPLIYVLLADSDLENRPLLAGLGWFAVSFVSPVILSFASVKLSDSPTLRKVLRFMGLQLIHSVPTAWDWEFSRTAYPQYVRVTLTDGSQVLGLFGTSSLSSSDRDQRDLYLEKAYRTAEGSDPWIEVPGSGGIYVAHGQIRHIEFWPINHGEMK